MQNQVLDTSGLPYAQVVFQIAMKTAEMHHGDILQIIGDCKTFERAVRDWCGRLGKNWLAVKKEADNRRTVWIEL